MKTTHPFPLRLAFCLMVPLFGCGDDDGMTSPDAGPSDDAATTEDAASGPTEWAALVRGTLFTDDLAMAQERHDGFAMAGEEPARAAGDLAHDVHLGIDALGTQVDLFAAVDRWNSLEGMTNFYADPEFQMGFATLFDGPPTFETFARSDWAQWGDLDATDGTDSHLRVIIRGRLVDDANIQAMHDGLAEGGREMAMAAGDVAHVVYLGLEDPREFLAFDLWTVAPEDAANVEAFYGNPDFMAAFGALFEDVEIGVFQSTDWHQW